MRFWVFDSIGYNVYYYNDDKKFEICERCKDSPSEELCRKNRLCITRNIDNHKVIFCLDKGMVGKHAKYIVKITLDAYSKGSNVQKRTHTDITTIEAITLHNVKKLNAGIGLKLERHINEVALSKSQNKTKTIESIITEKKEEFARDILSIIKSIRQIESEYALAESLRGQATIKQDLTKHRAHTVVVMSYYMFEEELKKKNIRVILQNFTGDIWVNFAMARSALSQIFSNSVKYCKPHSEINVTFTNDTGKTTIQFEMESRFFTNDEAKSFFLNPIRGLNSNGVPGEGIGLFAAYRMMQMNGGQISCYAHENTKYSSEDIYYSNNLFSLVFMKDLAG